MANLDLMIEVNNSNLSIKTKAVLNCLAMHCLKDDVSCFPSIRTICKETGASRSTVNRAIKELVELNIVKKEPRFSKQKNGGQTSNMYYLDVNLKNLHTEELPEEFAPEEYTPEENDTIENSPEERDTIECLYSTQDCVYSDIICLCSNPECVCKDCEQKDNTS